MSRRCPAWDAVESRIQYEPNTGCWLVSGNHTKGYAVVKRGGRAHRAHRISYEHHFGPIKDGLFVCHRCDTPPCVNPDHLFLGTPHDNVRDMLNKGRKPTQPGSLSHFAKIGETEALEIALRLCSGEAQAKIAKDMRVTKITVSQISCGKSWRHVTGFERRRPIKSRPDRSSTARV